jgi:hypothetical protein
MLCFNLGLKSIYWDKTKYKERRKTWVRRLGEEGKKPGGERVRLVDLLKNNILLARVSNK